MVSSEESINGKALESRATALSNAEFQMLTVIVPTRNRSPYLLRLLSYYREQHFNHRLLILDSSDPEHARKNRLAVDSLKGSFEIEHKLYGSEVLSVQKVDDALSSVDTPYAVLGADDDFIIPATLNLALEFLQSHTDYSLVHGEAITFSLESGTAWGQLEAVWRHDQGNIENPSGGERLVNHFTNYSTTWHSVHRTKRLRENLLATSRLQTDLSFGELLPSGLSLIQGKAKKLDGLYMARQGNTAKLYVEVNLFDWITSPNWPQRYDNFRDCLAEALVHQDQIGLEEARAKVKEAFWSYLAKYLARQKNHLYPSASVHDNSWRQVARSLPGARRIRETFRHLNKRDDHEISLPGLLQPSSPYHADFMPVYRAVTTAPALDSNAASS
jgi:glycosyltransferase domain-containing protein